MPAPIVAIIGRPNVGKSTFFNRVLGERRAVVHDRPGITRDRHTARGEWSGRRFVMIDTGGFLPTASEGRDVLVRRQAEAAIGLADAVLFMVDARTGATDLDTAIARSLRRQGTPVLLVVNKVDTPHDPVTHDFHRLGIGVPHPISSENGTGIGDLLDALLAVIPESHAEEEAALGRIAVVGRPNVGKSSIVNALLHEERMIVEPRPGTTLDAIDTRWDTAAGTFVLVDTAGIRRQSEFADQAEFYAVVRALQALQRADVAAIIVDATLGFQKQEARLVHEAFDAGCSVLLLYNKWDLIEGREEEWKRLMADRERRYPTLGDLPAAPVSAVRGIHLHRLPAQLAARVEEHTRHLTTARLNDWLKEAQRRRGVPSTRLGHVPKLYYATQTGRRPPEVTVFVNDPRRLLENYRRFLWLHFVEHFAFRGTPVRMRFRKSE